METLLRLVYCCSVLFVSSYSFRVKRVLDDCGSKTAFTAPTGIIRSHAGIDHGHHYGKSMRCTWHIRAPAGWFVELVAETFYLEGSSSSCYNDYLALYDGQYLNSTFLGKYCGTSFLPISSTGRDLTLQFITNSYNQYDGFKIHYNFTQTIIHSCISGLMLCTRNFRCVSQSYRCDGDDDCGDDTDELGCPPFSCLNGNFPCVKERQCISPSYLCDGGRDCSDGSDELHSTCKGGAWKCGQLNYTGSSGTINSPNYPNAYPVNMACDFEILAPNGTHNITLRFASSFRIEDDTSCAYDYLKVLSGNLRTILGQTCGSTAPSPVTVPGDRAIIQFNSDGSDSYTGFKLTWTAT